MIYFIISSDIEHSKKALKMLMETLPESHRHMQEAFETKDIESLIKVTHKLHGGLSYCGVPRLQQAVSTLETSLKKSDLAQLDQLYQIVCSEIDAFVDAYKKL